MNIVIAGATGGIGLALCAEYRQRFPDATLIATCRQRPDSEETLCVADHWLPVDLTDDTATASFAQQLMEQFGHVDQLINAIGMLHTAKQLPEKSIQKIEPDFFLKNMQVNVLPTLLLSKHCGPLLKKAARLSSAADDQPTQNRHATGPVFATVSAKVGSIEDNRLGGWYSYRSSKAALNMALKTLSIEWQRTLPSACVVALHPGTTDTALSVPFQARVPAEQLFSPAKTAQYLVNVIMSLTPDDTGSFIAFDGERLPW